MFLSHVMVQGSPLNANNPKLFSIDWPRIRIRCALSLGTSSCHLGNFDMMMGFGGEGFLGPDGASFDDPQASEGEADQVGDSPPRSSRKAKAKTRSSGSAGGRRCKSTPSAKHPTSPQELRDWKKCSMCKRFKEVHEFFQDMMSCRVCYNHHRAFQRAARTQSMGDEMKRLEQAEPKVYEQLFKQFRKSRDNREKAGSRVKFTMNVLVQEIRSQMGTRKTREYEMMWEAEFYEAAKTAKFGYLTKEEMEVMWNQFLQNPEAARDNCGPKGFLRLAIPVKDKIADFEEIARSRSLRQEEKLSKNVSAETLRSRAGMVMNLDMDVGGQTGMSTDIDRTKALSAHSCARGVARCMPQCMSKGVGPENPQASAHVVM